MAKINVESGGTILSSGLLQLSGGAAMSGTLTAVTDQNNTASQLKLASNLTQVAGTLQIQTDTATYIDVEDGSGNNRFTVSRQPASQQVSVDFASVPTDLTTVVGAIRTATNGSTLANIVSFTEAGNVGFGTDTPGTKVDIHSANNTVAQFNRTGTGNSQIQHLMTGTARWTTGYVNATGNYSIFDNVNSVFRTNLSNTGKLTIGNGDTALTGQLNVKGAGSTSATTSLLVQNSAGTSALEIKDDRSSTFGGNVTMNGQFITNGSAGLVIGLNGSTSAPSIQGTNSLTRINGGNNVSLYLDNTNNQSYFTGFNTQITAGLRKNTLSTTVSDFSGNNNLNDFTATFSGTLGTNTFNQIALSSSGTPGSGTPNYRGIYINPLQTGFGFVRAIESTVGGAYFNTSSVSSSAILQADSTTQGFLPPRMTNAQRLAIASPAVGLMVYCTDAVEGLYVYKSTGWTFVI